MAVNLSVVCVLKSGGVFTPKYVHRLKDMVANNIQYSFRFVCLTDYVTSYFRSDINIVPFWVDFPLKWCKINLWNPYNSFLDRILYLDLDSVVLGDLTPVVDFPHDFGIVKQWKKIGSRYGRSRNLNYKSALMVWDHNARPELWHDFSLGILDRFVGDQDWIGERLPDEYTFPVEWFNEQRYFKKESDVPDGCKVLGITDHGKNEEAIRQQPWLQKYWGDVVDNKRSKVVRAIQDKLTVVTFLWGDWEDGKGELYVRKLRDAVARNLSIPHDFVCITDQEFNDLNVTVWPLVSCFGKGSLPKLSMFNPYYPLNDRCVVLDLDMVITGSLDEIFSYDGEFAVRAAFKTANGSWQPDGDMFVFNMGKERRKRIWDEITNYRSKIESKTQGSEVKFYRRNYERYFPNIDFIQEMYPGQVLSYKQHNVRGRGLPSGVRVVSFHGRPKPHELQDSWIKEHWR